MVIDWLIDWPVYSKLPPMARARGIGTKGRHFPFLGMSRGLVLEPWVFFFTLAWNNETPVQKKKKWTKWWLLCYLRLQVCVWVVWCHGGPLCARSIESDDSWLCSRNLFPIVDGTIHHITSIPFTAPPVYYTTYYLAIFDHCVVVSMIIIMTAPFINQ